MYANWDEGWKVTGEPKDLRHPDDEMRIESFRKAGNRYSYGLHIENFLDCVGSRERPAASLEVHFRTCTAIHLGNIAYKVGRRIYWDRQREQCFKDRSLAVSDLEANVLLDREYRKGYELPSV